MRRIALIVALGLALTGCAGQHKPKPMQVDPPVYKSALAKKMASTGAVELDRNNDGKIDDDYLPDTITRDTELAIAAGGKEDKANKGQPGGYASLGSDGLVPTSQLPASSGGTYTDAMARAATGSMVSGNTETGIAVTYDSGTGKLNFTADFSSLASLYQPLSTNLTNWSTVVPTTNGKALVSAANYTAMRTLLGLVPGTDVQAYDPDLLTAASANSAPSLTYFGKNSAGTVGFHALPSGGTPGGSDTQVQFNDGGVLGGDSGLVFNKSTDALTVGGTVTASSYASTASDGNIYAKLPSQTTAPASATVVDGFFTQAHNIKMVENSGTAKDVAGIVASGTATLGTSAIASGACASVVSVPFTGVVTSDIPDWGWNTRISQVTGYGPSTSGSLRVDAYCTAGNVNFEVCNQTSASITPGAVTINWRIIR